MINLMFCGNDKMFDGLLIALLSIAKNASEELNVYILTMDLTEKNKDYRPITQEQVKIIEDKIKEKNKKNKITLIDTSKLFKREMMKCINMNTHYTPYIFIRLLSDLIKELPNKILYLDCDIVCYRDIKEIYDTDISDYEIAAALDYLGRRMIHSKYMNSGVVLMNLDMIRKTKSFRTARKMCKGRKMMLPDQTAINKACKKKIWLDDKCNEQKKRREDTIIRHFSMTLKMFPIIHLENVKPWQIEAVHKRYKIYDYEDIIEEYTKTKEAIRDRRKNEDKTRDTDILFV